MELNCYEREFINFHLEKLTKAFLPISIEVQEKANLAIKQVMAILKKNLGFIDRFVVNLKKATCIKTNSFECYVYVDDRNHTIQQILESFSVVLNLSAKMNIINVKPTPRSILFSMNGLNFELIPAINLNNISLLQMQACQLGMEHQMMSKVGGASNPVMPVSLFNNSFYEAYLEFLDTQCDYVKNLVRFCLLWDETLFFTEYIPDRTKIIELIAIQVGNRLATPYDAVCLEEGFREFLIEIQNLDSVELLFREHWVELLLKPVVDETRRPIILDPTNPHNNLAAGLSFSVIDNYKAFAKETWKRMMDIEEPEKTYLHSLFEPQPIKAIENRKPVLALFLCRVEAGRSEVVPTVIARKRKFHELNPNEQLILDILKNRVHIGLLCFTARSDERAKKIMVIEYAQKLISKTVLNRSITWSSSSGNHEARGFSVVWPYTHIESPNPKFLVISFDLF